MTVQEVFNIAMRLIDVDPTSADDTVDYKAKTPNIITMLQNEICRLAPIYKSVTITESGTTGYVKVTLPADYISIYEIVDENYDAFDDFKKVGNDIYVPYDFNGTRVYRYIPEAITDLTDTLDFNDLDVSTVLANGLASRLLVNEKVSVANFYNGIYDEMKRNIKTKQPASITKRKDLYGSTLKF